MDNLGILVQAILSLKDTTSSKNQIAKELPKLESQLQSDKNTRVKIVAGLDIAKSKNLIQSQLNTLVNQAKAPAIKIGIDTSGFNSVQGATQNITNGLKNVQTQAQQTANSIHEISTQMDNFKFPVVTMRDKDGNTITDTVKTLQNARDMFSKLGFTNVKFTWADEAGGVFDRLTAKVTDSYGAVQNFKFALLQGSNDYTYDGAFGTDSGVEKLITSMQKAQDKVKALRTNLTAELKSIRSAWQDVNGGKSVKSDENIERLKQQYIKVAQAIRDLRNADDTTLASMKANADAQIDKLNQMVTQYHNAEKVATQLRAKGFETVKIDTGNNIDKFINSINNSKVPIQSMQTEINKLTSDFAQLDTIQDQAGKSAALTNILNTLDNAKTKFQSLKELFKGFGNADWLSVNSEQINKINDMATKIAIYKNNLTATRDEWKLQGIYVGEIQAKVTSLARSLPNIKKPEKFNEWVQEWNDINQKANQLKINLDSQVATHNKIYEIQSQIAKLNPTKDSAEIARLNEKLSAEQKTLSNLQMQSNVYSNLVSLEQQEQYITEQTVKSRDKLLSTTNSGVKQYQTTITNAITELQGIANSTVFRNNASNPQVTQTKQEINSLITAYQNLTTKLQGNITPAGLETVRTELTQLNARFNDATTTAKRFETELRSDNGAEQLAQKVALLTQRIKAYRQANSKSEKMFGSQYDSMLSQLANPNIDLNAYNALNKQFQTMRQEINAANVAGKNLWQTLKEKVAKFTGWMSMTYAVSLVTRTIRGMVTDVVELDTALIDLKKTFKGTNADLKEFYYEANNVAKQLGVTTQEVINTASSWSRLGYNTKEAAIEMSKYASMFKMISPNMSIEDSTDGLLSVMKAFDIEVNDVLDGVMSKINKVGNEFGTSNNEIVQMLMRSSSAMKEGNNTLAETIALETSAVEITRDYASVGTAYKTLAMRLRGYDEELETYSNDVQVLSGEIADLTKTAKNPSGVSLFKDEAKTEYKSTLEILRDIREVYDDLDDKTQAQLLEKIAGKRQGQIVAATLSNWDTVEKALVAMENADGSALNEMNTVMESISYRANIFRETLVGIAQGSFSQTFLTSMVDSGTRILNVFDDLSPSISFILEQFATLLEFVTKLADTIGGIPLLIAGIGLKNVGSPKMFGLVLICQQ